MCDNNRSISYYDKNECSDDFDFLDCRTNGYVVVSSSYHPDNNHNQEEKICEAVFLSPDEILDLLACDFEKCVSASKDTHIFPYNVSSFNEVISPKFDVERDTKS